MGGSEVMAVGDGKAGVEVVVWMSGLVAPYLGTNIGSVARARLRCHCSEAKQREVI